MPEVEALRIGGLTRFTTVDFPGHLAAVVFCQGCPWRCGYCHNPHLQGGQSGIAAATESLAWDGVLSWLRTRHGLLDGVAFSGGEPLLQPALPAAIREARQAGFAVGLHTAGIFPDRLETILPDLTWVGLDLKAPFGSYARITGVGGDEAARASLALVTASGKPYEVRCTLDPDLLDADDLLQMTSQLQAFGISRFVLQPRRTHGCACTIPAALTAPALAVFPGLELRTA
ncbi:anaerobic ribonucleoside-triphosphate reductase activating protein [Geothrix sp. PMB-07]|uniref:anaerobic ribonucleoside-triphosphate reductase activating protein n=1 Tax=Geothrix sp. PMB-07 TaxID=3068640 RepID=UPI002740CCEC|nr:anaerobic ribonucleoside-triphosphate reductase activating protein [Geothrix sp. PMB-07]WLT30967.1 anaerobic ribonucleoside-triphosphate reductase activating protein [Geothrix sp. PMB-07]